MSFARKIGLKSLILDKNAQNWPNLGSLGPHKSKTAYGMTKIFFLQYSTYLADQSQ